MMEDICEVGGEPPATELVCAVLHEFQQILPQNGMDQQVVCVKRGNSTAPVNAQLQ